jgi:hypothetical protein
VQSGSSAKALAGVAWQARRRVGALLYRVLLAGLCIGVVAWSLRSVWPFTIDDAGISYAYAKHLADGLGPVAAIGGPRIEGYSNPLWVFLLVPVQWLGLSIPATAKALGALFFVGALGTGVAHLGLVTGRGWRSFSAVEAGFVIAAALTLEIVVWVPAGLENALFSALLLGVILLDAREAKHPHALAYSGLAAFALSITRPEAIAYAGPLLAIKLVQALRKREATRQAWTAAAFFVVPLALYHGGHYLVFGELVPNTYYAKPVGNDWSRGAEYLRTTLRESGLVYALPLAFAGIYGELRGKLLAIWAAIAGGLFILYSGGDWMPHGRFLSLFAPAVLLLAALGLGNAARLAAWLARGTPWHGRARELAALTLAAALLVGWWRYQAPRLQALNAKNWCHFCERVADTEAVKKLAERAGFPSHSIVTHDFGGPSWLGDEHFYPIDFLGLCDRSIVLIRGNRSRGGVRNESRFYQYLINEQPLPPSWILVPPNFWPGFDSSPEFLTDYYALDPRLLPKARRDSFFALHRGELVDYFPPVPNAASRPLTERLTLGGFALFADPLTPAGGARPGSRVLALLSLWPRGDLQGSEQISVRVEAGGRSVDSQALRLDRGIRGVGRQLRPGEPLSVEYSLVLPDGPAPSYRFTLSVSPAAGDRSVSSDRAPLTLALDELSIDAVLPPLERALPRYPSALPPPKQPELMALREAVTRAIEQSRRQRRAAPADESLSERLIALGRSLEAAGQTEQAYLAYVWATQVDRRAWERLATTVHRLRPTHMDDEHWLEIALLRQYYANGTPKQLAWLVAYYLMAQRTLEADYFARRWSAEEASHEPERSLQSAVTAALERKPAAAPGTMDRIADPLAGALDFETESLERWEGDRATFRAGPRADAHGLKSLRGQHGSGFLSSTEGGDRAVGTLSSPEFPLSGSLLSLLVGGGSKKRRVGVELVIDGQAVLTASGNDSDNLLPVLWNIEPFAGKTARLRVFDHSPRAHVCLDRIMVWR